MLVDMVWLTVGISVQPKDVGWGWGQCSVQASQVLLCLNGKTISLWSWPKAGTDPDQIYTKVYGQYVLILLYSVFLTVFSTLNNISAWITYLCQLSYFKGRSCAIFAVMANTFFENTSFLIVNINFVEPGVGLGIGVCCLTLENSAPGIYIHSLALGSVAKMDGRLR